MRSRLVWRRAEGCERRALLSARHIRRPVYRTCSLTAGAKKGGGWGSLNRALYSDSIADFLAREADEILGVPARCSDFAIEQTQRDAWLEEIRILHLALSPCHGSVYFEYSIPRMGRRIDVVLLIGPAIFVLEFKVGEQDFALHALEATEFHIQGLELDWTCVTWDADFRYSSHGWEHWSFCGDRWHHINNKERRNYLKNAYRVLLTRARQGMVIIVPPGEERDRTRSPAFYNPTFDYLKDVGFPVI